MRLVGGVSGMILSFPEWTAISEGVCREVTPAPHPQIPPPPV